MAPEVLTCTLCGHTACVSCAGRPEHEYDVAKVTPSARTIPSDFLARLKRALPMVVRFEVVSGEDLDKCKPAEGCDDATWTGWTAALQGGYSVLSRVERFHDIDMRYHRALFLSTWHWIHRRKFVKLVHFSIAWYFCIFRNFAGSEFTQPREILAE